MPACVSIERRKVLEAFGAELILSPANGSNGRCNPSCTPDLCRGARSYFMPNQFDNPANILAHYETTGKEILEQTHGTVTHFIAGMGTTGTLMGVGRRLKEHNPPFALSGLSGQGPSGAGTQEHGRGDRSADIPPRRA